MAPSTPRPSSPPEPIAVTDCVTLYVVPDGSRSGFVKPMSRSFWYGSSTSTPTSGSSDEHRQHRERRRRAEHEQVPPADAGDEEAGRDRGRVDERRAEVGLHEDEQDRHDREADGAEHDAQVAHAPAAVGEEAGEREDEEQLAELGRLELEEADVDPAPRAARLLREREHEQHQDDRRGVERPLQAAVAVGVDGERDERGRPRRAPMATAWRTT